MNQSDLFGAQQLPHGLIYRPDFLSADEEQVLLAAIRPLGFREARFQQYTARRRVVRFGSGHYLKEEAEEERDFPRVEFPPFLYALRARAAALIDVPEARFVHGLVTEYSPGTPIGWHRDAPHFETIVGVSLQSACRMRFRPMAMRGQGRRARDEVVTVELQPRSVYVMQDDIRWKWQHSIPEVKAIRYSITLRTLVAAGS